MGLLHHVFFFFWGGGGVASRSELRGVCGPDVFFLIICFSRTKCFLKNIQSG